MQRGGPFTFPLKKIKKLFDNSLNDDIIDTTDTHKWHKKGDTMKIQKPTKTNQLKYIQSAIENNDIDMAITEYRIYRAIGGKKKIKQLDQIIRKG